MPSEKVLKQKQQAVEELAEKMQKAVTGVLVDYRGLTVEEDTKLRANMRNAGVEYSVVKNTLTRFAANKIGFEGLDPVLNGPTSMALSFDDAVAPAKILVDFAKENENLEIKAGFLEGNLVSIDEIKNLASLPSKEVLVGKMMGSMMSPLQGFVNVLNGNLTGFVRVLNGLAEKKAAAGE